MAILNIKVFPDPVLRKEAAGVDVFDEELKELVEDMKETMYARSGIGLAAPQVGVLKRVIVVDVEQVDGEPSPIVLVNPEIQEAKGWIELEEGCLSVPGIREKVKRRRFVHVKAWTEHGEPVEIKGEGLLAVVLQHEIDHLDGILFIDRLSPAKKKLVKAVLTQG